MTETADVVIIGGGCIGASLAWQLAKQGAGRVLLLEKAGLAGGATGWSSAIVRTHYNHEVLARIALRARGVFEHFAEAVGGEAGFHQTGFLVLVGPQDADTLRANVAMHRTVGIEVTLLSPDQASVLAPQMILDGVGLAAWEPRSGYADPHGTTLGFAAAARRHGAQLRLGVTALSLDLAGGQLAAVETSAGRIETRTVVVAAGYRTRDLVQPYGLSLPLTPVRHDLVTVQRTADFGPPHPIISDRELGAYYRPEGETLTLVGATAPLEGVIDDNAEYFGRPDLAGATQLMERFCRRFPSQEAAGISGGLTAVYDCTPDLQPLLGPAPGLPGVYLASGFTGHGFKLSPVIGELLAQRILTGHSEGIDIDLFDPARFDRQQPIKPQYQYSVAVPA